MPGTALSFNGTFGPSTVIGTDFEKNGADVSVENSSNIALTNIYSLAPVTLNGDTRNVVISGGVMDHLLIAATTKRIRVENITTATATCQNGVVNNNTGMAADGTPNVVLSQIGNNCGGQ